MKAVNICIIHYNTPKFMQCLIKSIDKYTPGAHIYVFDNSDKAPFKCGDKNVTIFDNTKGQIINFDEWLLKYPKRKMSHGRVNGWGSAKHCYSVEKCMNLIGKNFILLDSDVLLKRDISSIIDDNYAYVGEVVTQPHSSIKRVIPFLCYINVDMCKKNKIHYFDDRYMHGLYNTGSGNIMADMYDTGAGFYINTQKYPHKNITWSSYVVHFGSGSWNKIGKKMEPNEWLNENRSLWDTVAKNKRVVYTCITGGYDSLKANMRMDSDFDYVCFTDNLNIQNNSKWELRPIPEELNDLSNVKKQRCIKINPHKYLSEYDISIWIDGSILVRDSMDTFLKKECSTDEVIFIPMHPNRDCIYREADVCVRMKKDTADNINPQMERYKKEGFPKKYGLVQSNIIVRKHNDPTCIKLMEIWWNELKNGSHRDQLSFNYALWKCPNIKIKLLDKTICNSRYFLWEKTHPKTYKPAIIRNTSNNGVPSHKPQESKKSEAPKFDAILIKDMTRMGTPIRRPSNIKRNIIRKGNTSSDRSKDLRIFLGMD